MKIFIGALYVLCAVTTVSFAATPLPVKAWTVMVYIAGDNNLAEAGLVDINEMETVGSTDQLNIVVQIDGSSQYTPEAPHTRRYYIEKDDDFDRITSPVLADLGETDMGSVSVLDGFITWAIENYPAERYAIILWNHGNGWYPDDGLHKFQGIPSIDGGPMDPLKAICSDESSGNSLSMTEVGDLMDQVASRIGRRIDLIGFDACLMGMAEVFYQVRSAALVACASSKTEPGNGWPYDQWLAILAANPDYDAERLGRAIVETYTASYSEGGSQGANNVTQSCIRFTDLALTNFEAALERFTAELNRLIDRGATEDIKYAAQTTQDFRVRSWFGSYFTTHRDLYDFAKKVQQQFPDDHDLAAGAALLMESIAGPTGLVVANGVTDVSPFGSCKDAHGVAVYLPTDGYEGTYTTLDFSKTAWFDFIHKLNGGKVLDGPPSRAMPTNTKEHLFGNLYLE